MECPKAKNINVVMLPAVLRCVLDDNYDKVEEVLFVRCWHHSRVSVACLMKENQEVILNFPRHRICERKREKIVGVPVVCITKRDNHEEIKDLLGERISEHTGEQIDGGLVPRVTKEILEDIKVIPQERTSKRTGKQSDGLVPHVAKQIPEESTDMPQDRFAERTGTLQIEVHFPKLMEKRGEVAR